MQAVLQAQLARLDAAVRRVPRARRVLRALLLLAHGFRGEAITLRAAALTYLTLLALVPLLAVVYSAVDLLSGQENLRVSVQNYMNAQLGLSAGAAIAGRLDELTTRASIKALGVIGFAALLVSVVSLLWNIESAFNHIYAVKKPRAPLQRLLKYWTFLTLGPVLLAGSVTASWKISQLQASHAQRALHEHSEILHAVAALSSIAITYAGLAILYKVLPNARVRIQSAVGAALAAGTAWELAKFVFGWASGRMVALHRIYGSLAVLPIVLTWIYITWLVTLVGCRLCYALDASLKPEPHPGLDGALARETFVARTMVQLALLHRVLGAPLSARQLGAELAASPRMTREALKALIRARLVVEARDGGYLPARELAQIDFADLRAAARGSVRYPHRDADAFDRGIVALWQRADGAAGSALGETVASFLARPELRPEAAAAPEGSPAPLLKPASQGSGS